MKYKYNKKYPHLVVYDKVYNHNSYRAVKGYFKCLNCGKVEEFDFGIFTDTKSKLKMLTRYFVTTHRYCKKGKQ